MALDINKESFDLSYLFSSEECSQIKQDYEWIEKHLCIIKN